MIGIILLRVYCRVGGLEKKDRYAICDENVYCRVGGLEKNQHTLLVFFYVYCRVGGLETRVGLCLR